MDKNNEKALCVEDHIGLILLAAEKIGIFADDEILQVGRISLWKAIKGYNGSYQFSTYALPIILRDIKKIRSGRKEKQLGAIDGSYTHSPISDYLPTLSEFDSSIINLFLEGNSLREIAKCLGKPKTSISRRFEQLKKIIKEANE